jgi:hypothetical protein
MTLHGRRKLASCALCGSKQTRTADPFLVRERQTVRRNPPEYVPPGQSRVDHSADLAERPRTAPRGYTFGYILPTPKGDTEDLLTHYT